MSRSDFPLASACGVSNSDNFDFYMNMLYNYIVWVIFESEVKILVIGPEELVFCEKLIKIIRDIKEVSSDDFVVLKRRLNANPYSKIIKACRGKVVVRDNFHTYYLNKGDVFFSVRTYDSLQHPVTLHIIQNNHYILIIPHCYGDTWGKYLKISGICFYACPGNPETYRFNGLPKYFFEDINKLYLL